MNLNLLPDVLAGAVVLTGTYVLVGLAWIIVFRAAHLVNFATGEVLVFAGYLAAMIAAERGYWIGVVLAIALVALLGGLVYRFLLRPFAGQSLFAPVIVTLGLAVVLRGIMIIVWGGQTRRLTPPFENTVHQLPGGIVLTTFDILIPATAAVVLVSLLLFLARTRMGGEMRASHENAVLASQSGINIYMIFAVAFALSFMAAGLAGLLNAQRTIVSTTAIPLGLKGLVPAMLGGLDSVKGVVAGAAIVAVAESMTILYLGARLSNLVVFSILLVVLGVRPFGLFGTPEVERV